MRGVLIFLVSVSLLSACAAPVAPTATSEPSPTLAPSAISGPPTPTSIPATPTPIPVTPTPTMIPIAPGQEAILDVDLVNAINLAGKWRFSKIKNFNDQMTQPNFDDSAWAEVDGPASWDAQGLAGEVSLGTVVVYRRQVDIPAEWKGQTIGIHSWFNPFNSQVFLNGERVEPVRKPFAPYADISDLAKYGEDNTIAVVTIEDGYLDFAESGPARLGPIVSRAVTRVVTEPASIQTQDGEAEVTYTYPAEKTGLPAFVMVATGSHGMAEVKDWSTLVDDLARQGYFSIVVALPQQKAEGVMAAVQALRKHPAVDPEKVFLFGADLAAPAVVEVAIQDSSIRGAILLSPPQVIDSISELSGRPLLLMASQKDRNGRILEQVQEMARNASQAQVAELPGNGHGTFLINNAWNALRNALLTWVKQVLKD